MKLPCGSLLDGERIEKGRESLAGFKESRSLWGLGVGLAGQQSNLKIEGSGGGDAPLGRGKRIKGHDGSS